MNAGTPTPGQVARGRLASAVHDLFGADCPNDPCPQCKRRENELMDLADDYAATGGLDSALADDYASLRKERDGLRGQLQAVRRLMADAMANGVIDSQAILKQLDATQALCPGGCGCRLGTDDADARECGCDGPCTGEDDGSGPTSQLHEFDYQEES